MKKKVVNGLDRGMRRALLSLACLLGLAASPSLAQNVLKIGTVETVRGESFSLPVSLDNSGEIAGGQFVLQLPAGLSVEAVTMNASRSNGHSADYKWDEGTGTLSVLFYAQPTAALNGTSGEICTVMGTVPAEYTPGTYDVTVGDGAKLAIDATTEAEVSGTEAGSIFVDAYYTVKVSASAGGKVTGGGSYRWKSEVELSAQPDEGYHFTAWSDGETDNPYRFIAEEDRELSAAFEANLYKVEWILDGETFKTDSVAYGTAVSNPEVPAKEGHTFSGWSGAPETMPAKDVTVTGSYSVNQYTLTYQVDGVEYKKLTLDYGAAITAEAAPTKEGHTFSGWSEIPATMPAQDVTVTGTFTANVYTVTYILDGETFKTEQVTYGTAIATPEVPAKEGYNFSGWGSVPATMPAQNLTFNGSYTINKNYKFNLIYVVDGVEYKSTILSFGDAIVLDAAPTKEGHTFSGWSEVPETMPFADVTVTGTFTPNVYTVTYILEDKTYKTEQVTYGTAITVPEVAAKEGYTFSGWGDVPATMPAGDLTFTGSYGINTYTLLYTVDGVEYKKLTLDYGAAITAEAAPTKEGHTFSGWGEIPATMPAKDVTVTGTFTANVYTVTYILDGEIFKTEQVTYGTAIATPEVPAKEGYNFSGWGSVPATMPAQNLTFSGSYTVNKDMKYNLIYMVDGVEYKRVVVAFEDAIVLEAAPTKEGHTFSGWSEVPETMPLHDVTVRGTFTVNRYVVVYTLEGSEFHKDTLDYGAAIVTPEVPAKEGHTFSGWGDVPATMPAQDLTFTGYYGVNRYYLTYLVDGGIYRMDSLYYGTTITPEAAPEKEGHTFSGWSEIPETMPAQDVTVEGTFTANVYTVTYILDGETFKTEQVTYGTAIATPTVPVKQGYLFSGWGDVPETMPAQDLTLTGSYAIDKGNVFNLIYMVDGREYTRVSVAFGDSIVLEAAPEKEGYTFSGWSEAPATMPFADVTITGTFTVNRYVVVYTLEGSEFHKDTLDYGAAIVTPEVPAKEGHTFSGWGDVPATMPAQDLTFTGYYGVNRYYLTYLVDGGIYRMDSLCYGTTITPEAAPEKEGHTFSGWSEIPETMPAQDLTVEGTFTTNVYTVTYILDGETFKTEQVTYGTAIVTPEVAAKEGHTFSGWGDVPATMPAQDLTFTGYYGVNRYYLTYLVDGGIYRMDSLYYGTTITPEAAPEKEGHTFSGWSEIPETMPAQDLTVEGAFTVNYYLLTYVVNGEVYKTDSVAYGTEIVLIEEPVMEGHIFGGWSEAPATMPAHDVEITGDFASGIRVVFTRKNVDVYTLQGVRVKTQLPVEEIETELPRGIYIIEGRKVLVK